MIMNRNYIKLLPILFLTLGLVGNAHAAPDIGQMFANFQRSSEVLTKLVQYSSYAIGLFLIMASAYKFSQLGQGQLSAKVPITMFFCGVGLFALTGSLSIALETMSMGNGPGSILAPSTPGLDAQGQAAIMGVIYFIRLIGYIAFVRGFLLLNQAGSGQQGGQGQQGSIGRGLTHIFGGAAAINLKEFATIIGNTIAPGVTIF